MGVVDVRAADLLWSTLYGLNLVSFEDGEPIDRNDLGADAFYASSGRSDGPVTVYRHVELALMMALTRLTGNPDRAEQIRDALSDSGEDVGYHLAWLKRERWDREDAVLKSGRDGVLVSDEIARAIAADYYTDALLDAPLAAFATGEEWNPDHLYMRVRTLITSSDEYWGSDATVELHALQDWVGERVPGIVVSTVTVPAEEWAAALEHGDVGPTVFEPTNVVTHVSDETDGEWIDRGDPNYPADWEAKGYEWDADGAVFVPETVSATVARLLDRLHVDSYSHEGTSHPGGHYRLQEAHPHTGDVTVIEVRLTGLTPEQEADVHARWTASMRPTVQA